jgi:hypothetical protein
MDEYNSIMNTEIGTYGLSNIDVNKDIETKYKKIIAEQSDQMIALVDISNAHGDENTRLNNVINQMRHENDELKETFNLQTLLFMLLALILFYVLKK